MTITTINFSLTDKIKNNIHDFEEDLKNKFALNNEIKIIIKRETPNQLRVDIQALFNGSIIKSHALSKRFSFAFKRSQHNFIENIRNNVITNL